MTEGWEKWLSAEVFYRFDEKPTLTKIKISYDTIHQFAPLHRTGCEAVKKSTARAAEFAAVATKSGVKIEAQYWTTGAYDGAIILSCADEARALQCLASLTAAGNVRTETLR